MKILCLRCSAPLREELNGMWRCGKCAQEYTPELITHRDPVMWDALRTKGRYEENGVGYFLENDLSVTMVRRYEAHL